MRNPWADERATGVLALVPGFEYRRPRPFAAIRMVAGTWLIILTGILLGYDVAIWLAPVLLLFAALHLYLATRLRQLIP
jgi:hypothetical protein